MSKKPQRNNKAGTIMETTSNEYGIRKVKSISDFIVARILDNRPVLGRIGWAKEELIEKIQALFRGSAVRQRIRLLKMSRKL